jgi:hypothetical protein
MLYLVRNIGFSFVILHYWISLKYIFKIRLTLKNFKYVFCTDNNKYFNGIYVKIANDLICSWERYNLKKSICICMFHTSLFI